MADEVADIDGVDRDRPGIGAAAVCGIVHQFGVEDFGEALAARQIGVIEEGLEGGAALEGVAIAGSGQVRSEDFEGQLVPDLDPGDVAGVAALHKEP